MPASRIARRTPSATFSTIAGRPMSSGRISGLTAVPMTRRGLLAGPGVPFRANTVACGVITPSQPPDQTIGTARICSALRLPCLASAARNALSARMRVKSLTPPLPSVLPMTATTSSALNCPARMRSSRPEASCTCLSTTFATSIAIVERLARAAGSRDGNRDFAPAQEQVGAARDHDADQPAQVGAVEELRRDRTLQRGNETLLNRPAGEQTQDEGHDRAPVDVAVHAAIGVAVELIDVDVAATREEEVGEDDAGPRAHPQPPTEHPVVERHGER